MNIAPFHDSLAEINQERGRAVDELNAAKARVAAVEARLQRLDRMAGDLEAIVMEAQVDGMTSSLPLTGLLLSEIKDVVGPEIAASAGITTELKRNRDRNDLILKVLATGPRDWELNRIVEEMAALGYTQGLTQPHDAIRVALDRMVKKIHTVVKVRPGTYRLMSRMAEPAPQRLPITYDRSIGETA